MIKIGTRTRHPNNILNNFMLKLCPAVYLQFHLVLKKTIWNIIVFILVLVFSSNEWNEHCSVTASMWPRLSKLQNSHKTEKKKCQFFRDHAETELSVQCFCEKRDMKSHVFCWGQHYFSRGATRLYEYRQTQRYL